MALRGKRLLARIVHVLENYGRKNKIIEQLIIECVNGTITNNLL
jgi:hypothetical protein